MKTSDGWKLFICLACLSVGIFVAVIFLPRSSNEASNNTPKLANQSYIDNPAKGFAMMDGVHSEAEFQSLVNVLNDYYPDIHPVRKSLFILQSFKMVKEKIPDASLYEFVTDVKNILRDNGGNGQDEFIKGVALVASTKMAGY